MNKHRHVTHLSLLAGLLMMTASAVAGQFNRFPARRSAQSFRVPYFGGGKIPRPQRDPSARLCRDHGQCRTPGSGSKNPDMLVRYWFF